MGNHGHDDDDADAAALAADETWARFASALSPRAPAPAVREKLLAELRGAERWAPFAGEIARAFGLPLDATRQALARTSDAAAWQPGFWPGSWFSSTPELQRARTVIARLPAGTHIPAHRHAGRELTYVLHGELLEDGSMRHLPGTLLDMPAGSQHEIAVAPGAECIVVFALPPA